MTRRVPELDRALPEALLNMNPDDCKKLGIQDGDMVKVKSTYGEFDIKVSTAGRTEPPAGVTFAPFFAEETLVNLAVQDVYARCPRNPTTRRPAYPLRSSKGKTMKKHMITAALVAVMALGLGTVAGCSQEAPRKT